MWHVWWCDRHWHLGRRSMRVISMLAVTFHCSLCVHSCVLQSRPPLTAAQHCVFDSFVGPIVCSLTFLPIKLRAAAGDSQEVTPKRKSLTCTTLVLFERRLVSVSWRTFLTARESNSYARSICRFEALVTATLIDFSGCKTLPELFLTLSFQYSLTSNLLLHCSRSHTADTQTRHPSLCAHAPTIAAIQKSDTNMPDGIVSVM